MLTSFNGHINKFISFFRVDIFLLSRVIYRNVNISIIIYVSLLLQSLIWLVVLCHCVHERWLYESPSDSAIRLIEKREKSFRLLTSRFSSFWERKKKKKKRDREKWKREWENEGGKRETDERERERKHTNTIAFCMFSLSLSLIFTRSLFLLFFFLFIHLLLLDSLHSSSFPHTNWYYSLVTTLFLLFPLFTSIIFPLFSRFILPSCSVYRSTLVRAQLLKRRRRAIFHFSISWFVPSSFFFVSTLLTVIQRRSNTFEKVLLPKKKKKKNGGEEAPKERNLQNSSLLFYILFFFHFNFYPYPLLGDRTISLRTSWNLFVEYSVSFHYPRNDKRLRK